MTILHTGSTRDAWPVLPPLRRWQDTCSTLHMWVQIAGKIRLELAPWINHSWGSALYVTTRGLTTSPIPYGARSFAIDFDFIDHALRVAVSDGTGRSFPLEPMTVAGFHHQIMQTLAVLDIQVEIFQRPVEVEEAIRFQDDDRHRSYDAATVHRFWCALVQVARVFNVFRARFIGKASPVHVFWGAFDLAASRFSGRTAPKHPGGAPHCADWVMEEAYSHEVASAGFWPGTGGLDEAAFYAYAYPEPEGFHCHAIKPEAAYFLPALGEFILPYEAVRTAAIPDQALLDFLQSTYEAAADLARWDRAALEREPPPRWRRQHR